MLYENGTSAEAPLAHSGDEGAVALRAAIASAGDSGKGSLGPTLRIVVRLALLIVILAGIVTASRLLHGYASLPWLASQEAGVREFVDAHWLAAYLMAYGIYVGLCLLPSGPVKMVILAVASGWLFGLIPGVLLASFAAVSAACLTTAVSRYLLADVAERLVGDRLARLQEAIEREGGRFLLMYRLIPGVPYTPVNWALGPTRLPLRTCWWATQLGHLPQVLLFAYTGSRLPSLRVLQRDGVASLLRSDLIVVAVATVIVPLLLHRWLRFSRNGAGKAGTAGVPEIPSV